MLPVSWAYLRYAVSYCSLQVAPPDIDMKRQWTPAVLLFEQRIPEHYVDVLGELVTLWNLSFDIIELELTLNQVIHCSNFCLQIIFLIGD